MSDANASDNDSALLRAPACDLCRARKVRCDRRAPCAQCLASKSHCHTTKKRPERRQRISVSGKFDRDIENVTERLAGLERLLESFVNNQQQNYGHAGAPPSRSQSILAGEPSLSTPSDGHAAPNDVDYEGDSSFGALSKTVTQVIERGLQASPREDLADVVAAVSTLRKYLNEKSSTKPSADDIHAEGTLHEVANYPELSSLNLPSSHRVLSVLRYAKSTLVS
jgi:hypothetical protein